MAKASEAGEELHALFLQEVLPVFGGVRCPGHGGKGSGSGDHGQAGKVWEVQSSCLDWESG